MQNFNIVRKSKINNTFRTEKIKNDFDYQKEEIEEHFEGNIEMPEKWNIGLIVGNSGTGKSTIIKELYGGETKIKWGNDCVINEIKKSINTDDITKMFYTVGFGSVPSWFKPYQVLSNGEKMRVNLAKGLLENDFLIFDEFTSVVDRWVAKTMCIAIKKAIKKMPNKKIIFVSCHFDIIEYLQPDWCFNTNEMKNFFQLSQDQKKDIQLEKSQWSLGENIASIII